MKVEIELARAKAEALLDITIRREISDDVVIADEVTMETGSCWVFFYNTAEYLRTGAISHALAGNAPIFVMKEDPSIYYGRSDLAVEDQIP